MISPADYIARFARKARSSGWTPRHDAKSPSVRPPRGSAGVALTCIDSDVGNVWIPANDGVMLNYIREYGTWDPAEGKLLKQFGRAEMVFVDVGASFGYFSRLMAKAFPDCTIHAFEPHPEISRLLELNTWEFRAQVNVWTTALGADYGSVGLTTVDMNVGDTRIGIESKSTYRYVAPVSRMDDIIRGRVDLVKMDTQGFEPYVLRGMVRILNENPQIVIVSEFYPQALFTEKRLPQAFLRDIRTLGLSISLVRDEGVVPADDEEIMRYAWGAGREGQATLVLRHGSP